METTRIVRWGILSTAGIGTRQVIPALQRGRHSRVTAIASRDRAKAEAAAARFGIRTSHGAYDDLRSGAPGRVPGRAPAVTDRP